MIMQKKTERRKKRTDYSRPSSSVEQDANKVVPTRAKINGKNSESHYNEVDDSKKSPVRDYDSEETTPKPNAADRSSALTGSPKYHNEQTSEKHRIFTQQQMPQSHKTSQTGYQQQPQQQSFTVGKKISRQSHTILQRRNSQLDQINTNSRNRTTRLSLCLQIDARLTSLQRNDYMISYISVSPSNINVDYVYYQYMLQCYLCLCYTIYTNGIQSISQLYY